MAVLDGGLPKWQREGRPVEAGDGPAPAAVPARFIARPRPELLRDIDTVRANVATG